MHSLIFTFLILLFLISCKKNKNTIDGFWMNHNQSSYIQFHKDTAFIFDRIGNRQTTYRIEGNEITLNQNLPYMKEIKLTLNATNDSLTFYASKPEFNSVFHKSKFDNLTEDYVSRFNISLLNTNYIEYSTGNSIDLFIYKDSNKNISCSIGYQHINLDSLNIGIINYLKLFDDSERKKVQINLIVDKDITIKDLFSMERKLCNLGVKKVTYITERKLKEISLNELNNYRKGLKKELNHDYFTKKEKPYQNNKNFNIIEVKKILISVDSLGHLKYNNYCANFNCIKTEILKAKNEYVFEITLDPSLTYNNYIQFFDSLLLITNQIRDEKAIEKFGVRLNELRNKQPDFHYNLVNFYRVDLYEKIGIE